jgi:hypothetical protein
MKKEQNSNNPETQVLNIPVVKPSFLLPAIAGGFLDA